MPLRMLWTPRYWYRSLPTLKNSPFGGPSMVRVATLSPSTFGTVLAKKYHIFELKCALWNKLQGVLHVPSGHDDDGIWDRKRTETKHVQPITVV